MTAARSLYYSLLGTSVLSLFFAMVVWILSKRRKEAALWSTFCLCVGIWSFNCAHMYFSANARQAYLWGFLLYIATILIPILFFHFTVEFCSASMPWAIAIGYGIAVVCETLLFLGKFFVIAPEPPIPFYNHPLIGFHLFVSYFFVFVSAAIGLLIRTARRSTGKKRSQLIWLTIGDAIGFSGGGTTFFYVYGIHIFPYGIYLIPIYVLATSYAVLRHQLLDINIVIRRTLVYSVVSAVSVAIYVAALTTFARLFQGFTRSSIYSSLLATATITLLFDPLRRRIQRYIDQRLFRTRLDREERLMHLSRQLAECDGEHNITVAFAGFLEAAFHPSTIELYLNEPANDSLTRVFISPASSGGFAAAAVWIDQCIASQTAIRHSDSAPTDLRPAHLIPSLSIALRTRHETLGALLLGAKRSDESYNEEDVLLLRAVADQAAMAYDRPRMVRRVSGGVAHEVKTPLANITLPAELSVIDLEELRKGNKSIEEVVPRLQKRLRYILEQSFLAAQRVEAVQESMSANVNFSKGIGVRSLIESSLRNLEEMVSSKSIIVQMDIAENLSLPRADPQQLEIVFVNLIKNACESMALSETREPRLEVSAQEHAGNVVIRIQDNGPGISAEMKAHLFQGQRSSKSGKNRGMGLFITHQIIQAHGGSIQLIDGAQGGTVAVITIPSNGIL